MKITALTPQNVDAIKSIPEVRALFSEVTKTTATLAIPPGAALVVLDRTIASIPGRGHPKASLYAVTRKIRALDVKTTKADEVVADIFGGINWSALNGID